MTDLIAIMSKLVDPSGKILIPGVDEMVPDATNEEKYVLCVRFVVLIHLTFRLSASERYMKL
jgi:hypothetical protein